MKENVLFFQEIASGAKIKPISAPLFYFLPYFLFKIIKHVFCLLYKFELEVVVLG